MIERMMKCKRLKRNQKSLLRLLRQLGALQMFNMNESYNKLIISHLEAYREQFYRADTRGK